MKVAEENRKNAEALLKLIAENPELPLLPMVDCEVIGDDYGNWAGNWGNSRIDYFMVDDERIRFKGDEDPDETAERILPPDEYEKMTDEEVQKFYDALPWEKAIVVYIGVPTFTN